MTRESDRRSSPSGVAPTSDSPANRSPARNGPERPGAPEEPTPATASRLRQEIDHGRTGDKVDAEDPSAVPLGTDDEAAGRPPTPNEVAAALDREQRSVRPTDGSAARGTQPWLVLAILAVAAVIALLAWFV